MEVENDESKEQVDTDEMDFSHPAFLFTPKANHGYRQQGPYLVCKSCEIEHAVYVGMERLLCGFDDKGEPILKSRIELGMS